MIYKGFTKITFMILLTVLFKFCYNEDCMTHSIPDQKYVKALTLENGFQLMVTTTGIFRFNPEFSKISSVYEFTDKEQLEEGEMMQNTINQVEITQFSAEEGGKNYILCLAKNVIYYMNEKGDLFFHVELPPLEAQHTISLTAYKYFDEKYYFIIAYNSCFENYNQFFLKLGYYFLDKEDGENVLIREKFIEFIPNINGNNYYINPSGLSCQTMISSTKGRVFTCFESIKNLKQIVAFTFNPDDSFKLLFMSEGIPIIRDKDDASYIKSSLNMDKSIAFICYSVESPDYLKCLTYNINLNQFKNLPLESGFCNTKYFGFNIYYFPKNNEYVISCINNSKNSFYFYHLNNNYEFIFDEKTFEEAKFTNCYSYYYYSIIYISKIKQYSAIINSNCNGGTYIRIFLLNKNDCIMPTSESIITELPETIKTLPETITTLPEIITTLPETITTLPEIITTLPEIITTLPETITTLPEIITTLPETITTLPETITTLPKTITTLPKTITTLPKTITTLPKTITTLPEIITTLIIETTIITTLPIIETSIPILETTIPKIHTTTLEIQNIKTTIIEESTLFSTALIKNEETNYIEEHKCEDINKIYYEGKCICDKNKGYYSFNYNSLDNKCYKIKDLPLNIYFNNITQSYEFCYKTCGECIKGGDLVNNNCLTCALDYTKEPENNSSNCVEYCKYLYYYDSLNQYKCTDDEQCPEEASLIIRNKDKCTSKCTNEDINIYQFNGECVSLCPNNTTPNNYYICQINNVAICSSNEHKLNLYENFTQENVELAAKNYAKEFYYTLNHISTFTNANFTMVLYKNSSCIDELKLNITKIEYESCIRQLKIDNNIDESKDLIIAIIDIIYDGKLPVTSFGFFDPDTGEKLDANKSCSDENVTMYEDILSLINDPLALKLLTDQKINIFDSNDDFYNDICFHFDSPNGKDATLQDRMKSFYPNVTLCDEGCKSKGLNLTTMKAECECKFQDLLSKNIFDNDLFGDNILIKESIQEISDMINNLNLEVLMCYKDVFNYEYFKKNKSSFIIIVLFILYTACVIYYYTNSKNKTIRFIYSLTEIYILNLLKQKKQSKEENNVLKHCPVKKNSKNKFINKYANKKNYSERNKDKKKDNNIKNIIKKDIDINNIKNKQKKKNSLIEKNKDKANKNKNKFSDGSKGIQIYNIKNNEKKILIL